MIKEMEFDGKQLPSDFPTMQQVKLRVKGLRYTNKKGTLVTKKPKNTEPTEVDAAAECTVTPKTAASKELSSVSSPQVKIPETFK